MGILTSNPILVIIFLTLLPFLELRASIPWGILQTDLSASLVFVIAVVTNIILGPIIYIFLDKFIHLFLNNKFIRRLYHKIVEKTQKKVHPYVEKYGTLGLSIFIGIPLPGSGSYSGALGAYLLGINLRKFTLANMIGVLIAGTIVAFITISGNSAFTLFIKTL